VKGQLDRDNATAVIATSCGHCGESISISTDGCTYADASGDARPLVFTPIVDLRKLKPNIIDGF
jgi:hypothetical protein